MTQTALNLALWSFFLSCFFFFLMHGMNYTSLKRRPNKEKQNSYKAAEIYASRLTENEENLFSIQKDVSIKTRMLEKR